MESTRDALIDAADQGDRAAADALFDNLYSELHRLARREVARQGPVAGIGVTTLLHEAYLTISSREGTIFPDRARFMGYAARVMRGLINLASVHLARKEAGAAEALLREALPIRVRAHGIVPYRRRTFPEDDWSVGATKSLPGATLAALARYDEAEAMLLDARRDLEAVPGPQGREATATLTRLVALYDAWGRPDRAAAYRTLLPS